MDNRGSTNRIEWADMARGYGIILVIIGHLVADTQLEHWIYSFHMPLFFFLSGYFFSHKKSFAEFIRKKSVSILIPYFGFGIITILFEVIYYPIRDTATIDLGYVTGKLVSLIVQIRSWALWYIACLFWLNILFFIIVKVFRRIWLVGIVSLLISYGGYIYYKNGGVGLFWNIDVCFVAVIFFYAGYLLSYIEKHCVIKRINAKVQIALETLLVLTFVALNVIFSYWSYIKSQMYVDLYMGALGYPLYSLVAAMAGIAAVVILSRMFAVNGILYIGKNSIVYYLLHQSIFIPISEGILALVGIVDLGIGVKYYWYYKIFQFIFILVALRFVSVLFEKTRLRVLAGRIN